MKKNEWKNGRKLVTTGVACALLSTALVPTVSASQTGAINSDSWNVMPSKTIEDVQKVWKVNLSLPIKASSVNTSNVYVEDEKGKRVIITTSVKDSQIEVKPAKPYVKGQSYTLFILPTIQSSKGVKMKKTVQFRFTIKKDEVKPLPEKEPVKEPELEVTEVLNVGSGRSESNEVLVAEVDPVTRKAQAMVSYKNEKGRQATVPFKAESHDPLLERMNIMKVSLSEAEFSTLIKNPNVEYVERNVVTESPKETSVPPNRYKGLMGFYKDMIELKNGDLATWGYKSLGLEGSVQTGVTGKGVKVAVLDSGISNHPDLVITGGVSQVQYTNSYSDDRGHGTHVAGIIGAKLDGQGLAGVAPDAKLYSVKTMNEEGKGAHGDIMLGIVWATENGMDVINMSTGSSYYSPIYEKVIQNAVEKNIVVVASSGNTGVASGNTESVSYPAKYKETIAVGSIDSTLQRSYFSGSGDTLDFVAPGGSIVSTDYEGGYIQKSGTSMAAPQITGMVALLKQAYPGKTAQAYKQLLMDQTMDLGVKGKDSLYGYGMVNFDKLFPTINKEPEVPEIQEPITPEPEVPEVEEPKVEEPIAPKPEVTPEEALLKYRFEAAERDVKDVEKQVSSQATRSTYARLATISVYELPESEKKKELISRLQAKGVYTPQPTKQDIDLLKAETIVSVAEGKKGLANEGYTKIVREDAVSQVQALPASAGKNALEERLRVIGLLPPVVKPTPIEPSEPVVKPTPEKPTPEDIEMSPMEKVLFESAEMDVRNVERNNTSPAVQTLYNRLAIVSVYDLPERKEKQALIKRLQAKGVYTPEPTKNEIDILKAESTVSVAESKKGLPHEGYTKHVRESAINKVAELSPSPEKKAFEERLRAIGLVPKK